MGSQNWERARRQLCLVERIVVSSVHPSVQSANRHLLSTCHVPASGQGTGDSDMNQADVGLELWEPVVSWGRGEVEAALCPWDSRS